MNNQVHPEIFFNETWFCEGDTVAHRVQITELSSSTDSKESPNKDKHSRWDHEQVETDDHHDSITNDEDVTFNSHKEYENNISTHYANCYSDDDRASKYECCDSYDFCNYSPGTSQQMNCYTILNHDLVTDSSSDEFDTFQVLEVEPANECQTWDHVYNDTGLEDDSNAPLDKRTIFIYSYKNNRVLSDNDFELVNIPSVETGSTHPLSENDKPQPRATYQRLGSPVPNTPMSRLDLSLVQTLPTVTEISEPNKCPVKKLDIKPRNNWLTERNDPYLKTDNVGVVNWMALSPRQSRRVNTIHEETAKTFQSFAENLMRNNNKDKNKFLTCSVGVQVNIIANRNEDRHPITPSTNRSVGNKATLHVSDANGENKYISNDRLRTDDNGSFAIKVKVENFENINMERKNDPNMSYVSKNMLIKNNNHKSHKWNEYLHAPAAAVSLHLRIPNTRMHERKPWFKRLTRCFLCCK